MPLGVPGEASPSMSVICPALGLVAQSTQVLPWFELKPEDRMVEDVIGVESECSVDRSVILKFFDERQVRKERAWASEGVKPCIADLAASWE